MCVSAASAGSCNGAALWLDWVLDAAGEHRVTSGILQPARAGHQLVWDRYSRQAAHLIRPPRAVSPASDRLRCQFNFTAKTGDVQVKFDVESA